MNNAHFSNSGFAVMYVFLADQEKDFKPIQQVTALRK